MSRTEDMKKVEAKDTCPNCQGSGQYMYDEHHSTGCDVCCKHDQGQLYTQGEHHTNPGTLTCGWCGTEINEEGAEVMSLIKSLGQIQNRTLWTIVVCCWVSGATTTALFVAAFMVFG